MVYLGLILGAFVVVMMLIRIIQTKDKDDTFYNIHIVLATLQVIMVLLLIVGKWL